MTKRLSAVLFLILVFLALAAFHVFWPEKVKALPPAIHVVVTGLFLVLATWLAANSLRYRHQRN